MSTMMPIGEFLNRRMKEVGLTDIFGVPGDFNLAYLQQIEDDPELRWIGTCNELNGAYAADGYARIHGLSALVLTHGVGTLSAINGVAGAFSEHVPMIVIGGAVPMTYTAQNLLAHHTLADGTLGECLRAMAQVTEAQAVITPQNATREIDRLILTAWETKRPVYLELPSDLAAVSVPVPTTPLKLIAPASDPNALADTSAAILARLSKAKAPAVLVDVDVMRYGLSEAVIALADAWRMSIATMPTAKTAIPSNHPGFVGNYQGAASTGTAREVIESSDCLLTIGHRSVDAVAGFFTDNIPTDAITLTPFAATVDGVHHQGVAAGELLAELTKHGKKKPLKPKKVSKPAGTKELKAPFTQVSLWATVEKLVESGDILIAENGTPNFGISGLTLPAGVEFINQPIWGSIGYTLPATLGTCLAAPDRRQLLFIGDGSFQMTAQELSTLLHQGCKPVIFLVNNYGYTIERAILGKEAVYNDVASWNYTALAAAFAPDVPCQTLTVRTPAELIDAVAGLGDELTFIELILDPMDAPAALVKGGNRTAELDYGPQGPQDRPGIKIEP